MKETIYYKAVEYFEDGSGMKLMYPMKSEKAKYGYRFQTYNDAEEAVNKAINDRKNQYSYFRDKDGNIVDKISYYNRHKLEYKIFKIKEVSELLYSEDNSQVEIKTPDRSLQEETPLTL